MALIILLYAVFFIPLPFIPSLWEANTLRHRMTHDVSRLVIGLHEAEIIQMLGEPHVFDTMLYYRLRAPSHQWFWQSLVIRFDENRIAIETISHINPYHLTHDAPLQEGNPP